jgi:flagellar biogenesis protein FliO
MMYGRAWMPCSGLTAVLVWTLSGAPAAGEPTTANQPIDLSQLSTANSSQLGATTQATSGVGSDPTAFSKERLPVRTSDPGRPVRGGGEARSRFGSKDLYWQGLVSLGVVLALIGLVTYAVRRWLPGMSPLRGGVLEILGRTHLSPKQSPAVVKLGRELVLVGITPDRISQLVVVRDSDQVTDILAALRHGRSGVVDRDLFDPELNEASRAYRECEPAGSEAAPVGAGSTRYEATRGQIRGLLKKVKRLTAGGRVAQDRWSGEKMR